MRATGTPGLFTSIPQLAPAPVGLLNSSSLAVKPPENRSSSGLFIYVSSLYIFKPNTKIDLWNSYSVGKAMGRTREREDLGIAGDDTEQDRGGSDDKYGNYVDLHVNDEVLVTVGG